MFLVYQIVDGFLALYALLLLLRALISWFPNIDPYNPLVRFLYGITDPIVEPIRRILPQSGPLDFSLLAAMLVVFALRQLLRILVF